MILLFNKESSNFSKGQSIPLVEIPIGQDGEKIDLNDFQWWAPTDKWQVWLKAHPREWKAESEEPISDEELFEFFSDNGMINPSVVNFEEFTRLMEEDKKEEGGDSVGPEDQKRHTKFVFAYNKLLKEGKIISDISLGGLTPNEEYALILDLKGEDGQPVEQTRNAYKFKPLSSGANSKLVIGEITETLLTGPLPEGASVSDTLIKVGKLIGGIALKGAIVLGTVALAVKGSMVIAGKLKFLRQLKMLQSAKNTKEGWQIFKSIKNLGGLTPFIKGTAAAIKDGGGLIKTLKTTGGITNALKSGSAAAKGSNPIGWIITGVMAAQQTYNWLSTKQAPRLGEIEDEGIDAQNKFSPGSIPAGSAITVCWTQEAGQSSIGGALMNIVVSNDTRTTMNLIKIGNFKGEALFYLVSINSEIYDKMLKENPTIFLSFSESATFNGSGASLKSLVDNDDIVGKMIIPPGGKDAGASAFFQGYCTWKEINKVFEESDDEMIKVSPDAPDEYSFHFKYGEKGKDVNVTGTLVKDLTDVSKVQATFSPSEKEAPKESNESLAYSEEGVLSFSDFSNFSINEDYLDLDVIFEEDEPKEGGESKEKPEDVKLTESQLIAAYEVKEIKFADASFEGETLPELNSFIVPNQYLKAKNNEAIEIEPIQNVDTKNPRKGTISIETEIADTPIVAPTGGTEDMEGGVPIEVTKDEIKSKHGDNPEFLNAIGLPDVDKIKDKDKDDKIKLLDFVKPEEKEQLGIEDWEYIKKVKIYKDGKTGEPYLIKFKSGGADSDRKRKISSSDPSFETALKVAERIQAGFKPVDSKEDEED